MDDLAPAIRKMLEETFAEKVPDSVKNELTRRIIATVPPAALPAVHQTVAVSYEKPKTAALVFDRIWAPFEQMAPEGIAFFGGTPREVRTIFHYQLLALTEDLQGNDKELRNLALWRIILDLHGGWAGLSADNFLDGTILRSLAASSQRWISEGLTNDIGIAATPVYGTSDRSVRKHLHCALLPPQYQ